VFQCWQGDASQAKTPPPKSHGHNDNSTLRHGIEPQVAACRFTLNLWIRYAYQRFIDLHICTGKHGLPHGIVNRPKPGGDLFHPLNHLLTWNVRLMPLAKLLLQSIKGKVIIALALNSHLFRVDKAMLCLREKAMRVRPLRWNSSIISARSDGALLLCFFFPAVFSISMRAAYRCFAHVARCTLLTAYQVF
jgi:hypothetical protein